MGSITVIGLGPGDFGLITLESWEKLQKAEHLYFRTEKHPTVPFIKERGVSFSSYDSFYEGAESFEALYEAIAKDLVKTINIIMILQMHSGNVVQIQS